ncbi:MAG: competence/damage-inducible protein A [Bacteroidia bacterium]|nr:competence/damage-inducible protein A [Bacteroidia bacterium]
MEKRMNASIISIGDELLIGQVVNTNAAWLAQQLNLIGIYVNRIIIIPDKMEDILYTLKNISGKCQLAIITGGMGPTKDDITKYSLCEFLNTKLVFSEPVFENIKTIFSKRNIPVSDTNRKQAEVPEVCEIIMNDFGTAPGLWFTKSDTVFVALPGVPFEMEGIVSNRLIPKLTSYFKPPYIIHKTIHIQGIPESHLSDMLEEWERGVKESGLSLAYLPQPGIVKLRISGVADDLQKMQTLINSKITSLQSIVPDDIFGYDNDTLESVVGELLKQKGRTLAAAESCTGGKIATMLTSVPGSSQYFIGSVVAYSNDVKINTLSVNPYNINKYGAVSQQVVEEMAKGILRFFNSDYAVATSGIAGPDGGTPEKPVGTVWIAVASADKLHSKKFIFGNLRDVNITRASVTALNMLRKLISDLKPD